MRKIGSDVAYRKRETKLGALFTDYDGTIAPLDVPRRESRVPESLRSRLVELSSRIPIAVITSKDYEFVKPRTSSFAKAWACVSGLDIRFADERGMVTKKSRFGVRDIPNIEPILKTVEADLPSGTIVERKRASGKEGAILGFSIDWRTGPKLTAPEVERILRRLRREGLYISYSPWQSYIDAFAARPDKGAALRTLIRDLGVSGRVAYLGDTDADNDAFDASDIGIGVDHGQPMDTLRCQRVVPFTRLAAFLGRYLANGQD